MTASGIDDALAADVGPLPNPRADRQAQKATPNAACFEQDLYARESDDGRDNTLEAFLRDRREEQQLRPPPSIEDAVAFRDVFREAIDAEASDEEIESPRDLRAR